MMNLRKYLISSLLFVISLRAFSCCEPDPVEPQWHWLFFSGYGSSYNEWQQNLNMAFREENITFWHKYVKGAVSRKAVEKALYDVYLLNEQTNNAFFRYLYDHHDEEALRYWTLLKASDSAYVQNVVWEWSIWYYSVKTGTRCWFDDKELLKHDPSISRVETLDESAIRSCKNKDIRNRFLLQLMRKCFYINDYQGCITLWERYGKQVPTSVLRKQCLNYYGGALLRVNRDAEAAIIYAEIGFYDPRLHYDVEVLRKIYEKDPDSKAFAFMVQEFVNTYFDNSIRKRNHTAIHYTNPAGYCIPDTRKTVAFNALVDKILRDGKNRNPALWKSAQAALAYINGNEADALRFIAEAEKLRGTPVVKDNIRMLRLVFNSTRTDINAKYEATILPDLQWLVRTIEKEGVPAWWEYDMLGAIPEDTDFTALHHIKILRRTILLGIIPHFERCGMAFKSMAYLNLYGEIMTNNDIKVDREFARRGQLRKGVNKRGYTIYIHPPVYRKEEVYLSEYGYENLVPTERKTMLVVDSTTWQRSFDYSTLFFNYMDTTSIANVQRFLRFMRSGGRTAAEKFVPSFSYRDPSFYNELIATKFMRQERYDSALVYLRKMSPDFPEKQNIVDYIGGENRNPFVEGWITQKKNRSCFGLPFNPAAEYDKSPGKITFCQLMLRLRKLAESDTSETIRAKAAYAYAVGLFRSTVGKAWALCYYEYGWNCGFHYWKDVPDNDDCIDANVHRRVDSWLDKALRYNQDHVFTTKCMVLHSKHRKELKRMEERTYSWGGTYKEEVFVPEVREMLCDRFSDYDPFYTDDWQQCAWYYGLVNSE